MNKKHVILSTAAVAAGVVGGSVAHAGYTATGPVSVVHNPDGTGYATGALGTARNSSDVHQDIGCVLESDSVDGNSLTCGAVNIDGSGVYCRTSDAGMVSMFAASNGDSFVTFEWDADNNCTYLAFRNDSMFEPKNLSVGSSTSGDAPAWVVSCGLGCASMNHSQTKLAVS